MKMQSTEMLIVFLLALGAKFVVSIEVYENINENGTDSEVPLKATLPNSSVSNGSQLAINEPDKSVPVTTSAVDYTRNDSGNQQQPVNNINHHHQYHQQKQQHHKHSSSYRDSPLPITPTTVSTVTTSSTGSPAVLSTAASPTASSGSAFKEDSVLKDIVGANLVQQQISGYKKRQLYANAFQAAKNGTNERSYDKQRTRQLSKEFIPSPELTQFSPNEEDQRSFQPGPPIDATYPSSVTDSDSKWFGANHINIPESFHAPEIKYHVPPKYEHHKSGKYLWLPNDHSHHQATSSESPFSRTKSRLPSPPKGKWKWVPEEEDGVETEKPIESGIAPDLESKIINGGHYFLRLPPSRDHPYSFEGGQTPFSSDETGGGGVISTSSSTTTMDPLMYFFGPATTVAVDGLNSSKLKTGAKGDSDTLKGVSPWRKIVHVLSAAIPIGLIISALTPQVVYINPNMTQNPIQMQTPTPISATGASSSFANPSRQRSEDQTSLIGTALGNPLIGFLEALSANRADPSRWPNLGALFGTATSSGDGSACEEKSFCEMARRGINHDADILFKMLWKIANETPAEEARRSGLEEIFRAVKDDDCSRFHCEST